MSSNGLWCFLLLSVEFLSLLVYNFCRTLVGHQILGLSLSLIGVMALLHSNFVQFLGASSFLVLCSIASMAVRSSWLVMVVFAPERSLKLFT